MDSILVTLASHNELSKRGEPALRRCLDSVTRSLDYLARHKPAVEVYVSCCDDASADDTPAYIERHFRGKDWFRLVRNRVPCRFGLTRNIAAAQFPSDLICFLDADDEYFPNHLFICSEIMEKARDAAGKPLLLGTTRVDFAPPIHAGWVVLLSGLLVISKVIRRQAWEFLEGFPTQEVYQKTGCFDQCLMQKCLRFFSMFCTDRVTARYWSYPGTSFDRQLHKFTKDPALYRPEQDDPPELAPLHKLRVQQEKAFQEYLRQKWDLLAWGGKLQQYAVHSG